MTKQHLGMLRISGELLRDSFFTPKESREYIRIVKGLPKGAVFIRMWIDETYNELRLIYSHPTFPEHTPGTPVPEIPSPMMDTLNLGTLLDDLEDKRLSISDVRRFLGLEKEEK